MPKLKKGDEKMKKDKNIIKALLFMNVFFFATLIASAQCPTVIWNLTAGQHNVWGTLSVTNDQDYIYVTYTLDPTKTSCSELGELHLWIGNDLGTLPTSGGGPITGQFPFKVDLTNRNLTTYTFTIPFSSISIHDVTQLCNTKLYIFAHAEGCGETMWGGDIFDKPSQGKWYFYGEYYICCDFGPPPVCRQETAFAKGGWVFTTDKKSNPENLPSLKLTRNRWGWAINLTSTGTTTYDIWAGAGLNNTANGTLVGTLTVDWNGTQATVKYDLYDGYLLKEVHIYAEDARPTTVAPGQYGHPDYFDPGIKSYTFTVPLADTDGVVGVWLIAHAVVEFVCK